MQCTPTLRRLSIVLTILCYFANCGQQALVVCCFNGYLTLSLTDIKQSSIRVQPLKKLLSRAYPRALICPLLFNLFINDIKDVIKKSNFLLYADDLKIFYRVRNDRDAQSLQNDLYSLELWSKNNLLHFNLSKCHIISFSKKRFTLFNN